MVIWSMRLVLRGWVAGLGLWGKGFEVKANGIRARFRFRVTGAKVN